MGMFDFAWFAVGRIAYLCATLVGVVLNTLEVNFWFVARSE